MDKQHNDHVIMWKLRRYIEVRRAQEPAIEAQTKNATQFIGFGQFLVAVG